MASRKLAPRAVDRNGFKRQAREVFRLNQHVLGGIDVVVKLRRPFRPDEATRARARAELTRLMLKLEKCRAC